MAVVTSGQCRSCCLLRAMTDGKGDVWPQHIFDHAGSCPPKITSSPWPYMSKASSVRLRRHHVSRPHNTGCVRCCAPAGLSPPRDEPLSPCSSPSSTGNVSSTSSPSWTRTAEGACPLAAVSCVKSFWTLGSGIYCASAPRVSWGGTTSCWVPRCATWLCAGTPAGCKCATSRTGWRARFRGTSAAITKALSALSWPTSATCEWLCVVCHVLL